MSQFGMQMPGGARSTKASPDIYTALLFLGVISMGVAVAMLWINGDKLSPEPNQPWSLQESGKIRLSN